jgi:hypothetical protein
VFVRTKLNVLKLRELPWDHFRFPEIAEVPSAIAERCFLAEPQIMKEMLDKIRARMPDSTIAASKFSVPLDML